MIITRNNLRAITPIEKIELVRSLGKDSFGIMLYAKDLLYEIELTEEEIAQIIDFCRKHKVFLHR